ncbi:MAG: amidohydrolase family protein [Desulfobacterales bacterium]|nr:amidohydrolase family protein [Desulfobacterales bacterium]
MKKKYFLIVALFLIFSVSVVQAFVGDINDDGTIDLKDAILAIRICSGFSPANVYKEADVNEDGRIGTEEAIYTLQVISGKKAADTVLVKGQFYTVDKDNSLAEAVAIKDGIIVYAGSMEGIDAYSGEQTEVVDLEGKFAMPSFVESHLHPLSTAYDRLFKAALHNLSTVEEYVGAIRDFAEAHPDVKGIMGSGFKRTLFDAVGPRKELLDAIDSARPIGIVSSDIHSMWVNSKALEMLGITKDTPDPEGGVIARDPETGEPAGLLQEHAAMNPAWELFPQPTKDDYKTSLLWVQDWLNRIGITTAHDAWTEFDPNFYEAYDELAKEGKLTVRFRGSWFIDPNADYMERIEYGLELSEKFRHPHFQVNSFKFLADNILEEETALLLEPYSHRPDYYGIKNWEDQDMVSAFAKADKAGYQIHVHVIGDGATKYTVDALEKVQEMNSKRDSRHSLVHIQLARPEDVVRMGQLGLAAHMSQTWMVMNEDFDYVYLPYLGATRANNTYPHKSMFDAGVNVTVASDLPTSEPDVMSAIYSGITRSGVDGDQLPPASECVTLEQMLEAATINGAHANFLEDEVGSLQVGKKADIVVLSKNLFEINTEEIPSVEIRMTFFEGKRVH